jgi:Tol biopolymer transport system component
MVAIRYTGTTTLLGLLILAASPLASAQEPPASKRLTVLPGNELHAAVSPDGLWVAFTHQRGGRAQVRIVSLKGGETRRLTHWEHEDARPSWSPDGKRVAFQTSRDNWSGVWVVDFEGGEPTQMLSDTLDIDEPEWSPDGAWIVYRTDRDGDHDLWIASVTGEVHRQLTDHPGNEWAPRWSPDSRSIVFYTTWNDAMTDVHTVSIDSGEITRRTDHPREDYRPAFDTDGTAIAFTTNRGGRSDLWRVSIAESSVAALTDDAVHRQWLDATPDGRFVLSRIEAFEQLYSVPASGGAVERISLDRRDEEHPAVSPDGRLIAFAGRNEAEMNVFVRPLDGRAPDPLTPGEDHHDAPRWSSDGSRLAFVASVGGGPRSRQLHVVSRDGGERHQMTDFGGVRDPIWADGDRWLVDSFDKTATYRHTIWKLPAEGGPPMPIVVNEADNVATDVSPDGRTVLFTSDLSGEPRIYTVPIEGGDPIEVEHDLGTGEGARWSPDGSRIAFVSNASGEYDLYTMAADGGSVTRVTHSERREGWPAWSPDGATLYFSTADGDVDLWVERF